MANQVPWGNQTHVLDAAEAKAKGYVMGPAGYYLDQGGNVAPGQVTPGMRDNPQAQIFYDDKKDLNYYLINNTKVYLSPYDPSTGGFKSSLHGKNIEDTGGGLVHGNPQWNPKEGKWDVDLDWGKIASWAIAGGLGAGVVSAAMAGGASTAAAGSGTAGAAGVAPAIPTTTLGTSTGLGAVGAGPEALAAASPTLAATPIGTGAAALPAGGAGINSASVLGSAGKLGTMAKIADVLRAGGKGLGDAATAKGNNAALKAQLGIAANDSNTRGQQAYIDALAKLAQLGLEANNQNISGEDAYQRQLNAREQLALSADERDIRGQEAAINEELGLASEEDKQRAAQFWDVARANLMGNRTHSPYNPEPVSALSADLQSTLDALSSQGTEALAKPRAHEAAKTAKPTYKARERANLPAPKDYKPYTVSNLPTLTPYKPIEMPELDDSTLQTLSDWLNPTLSTLGTIADLWGK